MPERPTMAAAVNRVAESVADDVKTSFVARVLKYDAAEQTVDIEPQVRDWVDLDVPNAKGEDWEFLPVPTMYNIPLAFPRGGGFHITLPMRAGDYVLVVCNRLDTLVWRQTGRLSRPGILDRHQINGCFALPCGFPDVHKLDPAPSGEDLVIGRDGNSVGDIVVKPNGDVHLGTGAQAGGPVALASKVESELAKIKLCLDSLTGGSGAPAEFLVSYSDDSVGAEKVRAE